MEVGGGPDRWPWLARLWGAGIPLGAGFLVDDRHVMTCAHVVSDVLPNAPAGLLTMDFPAWRDLGLVEGTVAPDAWFPVDRQEQGDLAVIRLDATLPTGMRRAPMRASAATGDHRVRFHGFSPRL